ncbi:serine/threonine-protein kinase [Roseibacillus persicicus]|uniref:Protein kinase domain-containing protein n=1 Tax=Roseibacillus persicicus TaxID=454148 RepID=A0A918TQV7_9BACT|nr:serine/threonine-protein kinase [Roseibacillus persicicus]GHC57889.1 hypothetical protein GCM10007100_25940 [Roseibacillus persicicus]
MADIAVCSECSGEMDVTAAGPFNRVACPNCGAEVRVKIAFGSYRLQQRLAYGGMSVLFVAQDQTLGREVALKVLNEEYSSDEYRTAQFEREAELTALVSHPNVVRVYSVGRAFERFYIAMELIAGESLEKRLETGLGLPEREVLKIALQVTAGLKAAKASGLIHRDIKPGNILVDSEGTAKIVDFGLSLVTQSGLARAQEIFATPFYAPPEALEAGVEDFRSDIYALGATLYHALAGKPPIESTSTNTKTLLEAKRQTLPLRKVAPSVSQSTSDLVSQMMAFRREERTASYDDVTAALQRALKGEAQPQVTPLGVKRKRGGNGGMVWIVVFVLLGLIGLGALALKGRSSEAPEEVVEASEVVPEDNGQTDAMRIAKTYQRARNALQAGKFNEAELNYLKLFRQKKVPEPTSSWAGYEAGLSALLDGRAGDSRQVFDDLRKRLGSAGLEAGTQVALEGLLGEWDDLEPFTLDEECSGQPEIAMVQLGKALKNWENGDWGAVQFFEAFAGQEFSEQNDWVGSYQDWARKLGADALLLKENEPDWNRVWSQSEVDAELIRLEELSAKLQTSGRARFTLESWQLWFKGEQAQRNARPWDGKE